MTELTTIEVPICGMDCSECASHVQHAIAALPGVAQVDVLLGAEKAVIRLDAARVPRDDIRRAVEGAGYTIGSATTGGAPAAAQGNFTRRMLTLLGLVFGAVLFVIVAGEWLGLFERITAVVPFWAGALLVLLFGYPIFRNVVRSALHRQVTSHTLMSLGVVAALAVGEWTTAAVVVFFMRVGDYIEKATAEGARRAVKNLAALAPQTARVERDGVEQEFPIAAVAPGDLVVVRPGEQIPVDGEVVSGQATVNQATITGESMPVEVGVGSHVYAATIAQFGSLRVRAVRIGAETTFGRVVRMVEDAEANRGDYQRFADKFSGYYLPVVAGLALLVLILRRDPMATAAVLVVACSCAIALATPIAMLAAIGSAARRGLLIKGGKYLELLARADVVLLDKTGTLTLGRPQITDMVALNGLAVEQMLQLAASVERDSEHPLGEAVRMAAVDHACRCCRSPISAPHPASAWRRASTVAASKCAAGGRWPRLQRRTRCTPGRTRARRCSGSSATTSRWACWPPPTRSGRKHRQPWRNCAGLASNRSNCSPATANRARRRWPRRSAWPIAPTCCRKTNWRG